MGEDEIFKKENVVFYSICTIFPIIPPHCDIEEPRIVNVPSYSVLLNS